MVVTARNIVIENSSGEIRLKTNGRVIIIRENSDICPRLNPDRKAVLFSYPKNVVIR